ncbi:MULTISPECIES: helix-turn-helix domain-containing protein [Paenibacillus]|uniref:Substrate-binding family protein n=1 Tax=Paenibacillus pabuli TaxID=1472 RepID=A0A855YK69_9BACL|nr:MULTISPECIES: helix-turn-helix domain-containing protein [Paenibacillus]PWW45284.1 substrate-binding family protein [Paenibacillus pabuli]PXW11621.1 substrate-binding family protein [Paenibacillus taichungensis]
MTEQLPFISETSSLPLLSSMCRVRRGEHFRVQGKTVSRPMLCLILQGDGVLVLNDTVYTAEAHQLYVLKPGTTLEAAARSAVTEFIILSMDTVCLQQVRGQWIMSSSSSAFPLDWETGRLMVRHDQQARARLEQLYEAYRGVHPDHFISIHSQLHELLQYLSENRLEENYEKVDPALERSIMYMRRFMSEGISMDQLAKIAGLTPSSYSRSFKKAKGMSPTDYLNRLRIDEAKKQLKQESCVLKDVAVSVGYGNEYYFSRKFKQTLGIAPSLYMKKDQIRVATASRMGLHENLSSLGLHPVAAMDAFHDRELDEVEQQKRVATQLEKLRQAKPDLIIGDFYHQTFYDKLKSIAPTVILGQAHDWKENHVRLAELVGREQQALQNFKQLGLRNLDIGLRLKHHFGQERIMLMQVTNQSIRLQENIEHPLNRLIYGELGLNPAQIICTDLMTDEYAADSIPLLDTDHLFMNRVSNTPASEKLLRRMKQTTAWNRSPAVLKGNVHDISDWSVLSWTPNGRHQIMDELEQIVQQLMTLSRVGLIGQL